MRSPHVLHVCWLYMDIFPVHSAWESRSWAETNRVCSVFEMMAPHSQRQKKIHVNKSLQWPKTESRVSVYLIICSANSSVRLLLNGPKGFWVWLLALWMWKPDFPLWFLVLLEQRSVWRCSAIRVSGLHLMSEPGGLSVSGREASSPLLSWVLLNARMRSIRDSGLQRL